MSRRAAAFTQADIRRAVRGVESAGLKPTRIELDAQGRIVVAFDAAPPPLAPVEAEEDDQWAKSRAKARAAAERAARRRAPAAS